MWVRTRSLRAAPSSLTPLEVFTQVQLGGMPPLSQTRTFIVTHFSQELSERGISQAKVSGMDTRRTAQLLKQLLYDRYLAVPFRLYTFDFEFTGLPRFSAEGPSELIVEASFYHPESQECCTRLVKPPAKSTIKMNPEAAALTGITDELLKKEGKPFPQVWKEIWAFLDKDRGLREGPGTDILLLSHGGKLADVSMLQHALKDHQLPELPSFVHFGDTSHILRDLHRKRPVTADKLPPSWSLEDVHSWMKLPSRGRSHRAEVDAKLTWDVLYHSLDRYGDETLTPKQQLVAKFFDGAAKKRFASTSRGLGLQLGGGGETEDTQPVNFSLDNATV